MAAAPASSTPERQSEPADHTALMLRLVREAVQQSQRSVRQLMLDAGWKPSHDGPVLIDGIRYSMR